MSSVASPPRSGAVLQTLMMLLGTFGTLSMDLYLPSLPAMTRDLGATPSLAQLTMTACLVGLAAGQLIAGPASDRFGRRAPLLIGITVYIAASVLCALSPSVGVLLAARLLQGLAGAFGLVTAQAAGRDLYEGRALVGYYARLSVLVGLASIVGPLIGGALAQVTDWRGMFWFLAGVGVILLVAAAALFKETHQPSAGGSGLMRILRDYRELVRDRAFLGAVLIMGFMFAASFAYVAGASFILQDRFGMTAQEYSITFGCLSAGFMVFGYLGGRAAVRWGERIVLRVTITTAALGALALLACALGNFGLAPVLVSMFVLLSSVSASSPPTTALALAPYPHMAGTASSLLGVARYTFGGIAAPLVGLGGADALLPLGIITVVAVACAAAAYQLLPARTARPLPADAASS